jgi:hypothetical protein
LDSVFKISETPTFPEVEPPDEPDDDELQAARASDPAARQTAATIHRRVARDRLTVPPAMSMSRSSPIRQVRARQRCLAVIGGTPGTSLDPKKPGKKPEQSRIRN